MAVVSSNPNVIINDLEGVTGKIIGQIARNVQEAIRYDTPIDTGWAKATWVLSVGPLPPPMDTPDDEIVKDVMVPAALAVSLRDMNVVANYRMEQGAINIANATPYITDLDAGSSNQAAPGFVARSIDKGIRRRIVVHVTNNMAAAPYFNHN